MLIRGNGTVPPPRFVRTSSPLRRWKSAAGKIDHDVARLLRTCEDTLNRIDRKLGGQKLRASELGTIMKEMATKGSVAPSEVYEEYYRLEKTLKGVAEAKEDMGGLEELLALAMVDGGEEDLVEECTLKLDELSAHASKMELEAFLDAEADRCHDVYLEVNAGAGGVDSMDFASMLLGMYENYAVSQGYKVRREDESHGDVAGHRNGRLRITGDRGKGDEYVYGMLKHEEGVHRLVRQSPFDSQKRRHTSFARVRLFPRRASAVGFDVVDGKTLKVDTYRSSGPGGQHVNTTDSAVRLTHLPTGIVAASQSQRSQHANRKHAMELLTAKLYAAELERIAKSREEAYKGLDENAWGQHFRSYILHPYTLLKDHRSGYETSQVNGVLSGSGGDFRKLLEHQIVHVGEG